jgi:DNA-directed RNA polymerase specialized sigma24 family protein
MSDIEQLEQQEALDSALASMPPEMRDMCEQLMAGTTPTTLARQFGISRRQIRRRLEEARAYFEAAGLGNS